MRFSSSIRALLALITAVTISSCAAADTLLTPAERGRRSYDTYCAPCHGLGGTGTVDGPSLLETSAIELDDESIRLTVVDGIEASTPDWPEGMAPLPALNDEEIAEVILHVRTLQGFDHQPSSSTASTNP